MPKKKTYARRAKRRYGRKRRMYKRANKRFYGDPIVRTPMPVKFLANLKYRSVATLNPGVGGSVDEYVLSCNGLYDVDISGGGHQPTGFDQLMAFYSHYTVIGAKIMVEFYNTDTNPATCGVWVGAASTEIIDLRRIIEQGARYTTLSPAGGSRDVSKVVMSVNPNKYLGISKPMAETVIRGNVTSNPTEQCYFHIFASPFDQSTDSGNVRVAFTIQYTAIFSEPLELLPS